MIFNKTTARESQKANVSKVIDAVPNAMLPENTISPIPGQDGCASAKKKPPPSSGR